MKKKLISDFKKSISLAGARTNENDYFRAMQHLGSTRIKRIRFKRDNHMPLGRQTTSAYGLKI